MEEENPVYMGLEYNESVDTKKDLLSSEVSLINIIKITRRYNLLRAEEMRLKSQMYKAVRDLELAIKKTRSSFPFLKIPETAKREEVIKKKEVVINKEHYDADLENQLRDIQSRLRAI